MAGQKKETFWPYGFEPVSRQDGNRRGNGAHFLLGKKMQVKQRQKRVEKPNRTNVKFSRLHIAKGKWLRRTPSPIIGTVSAELTVARGKRWRKSEKVVFCNCYQCEGTRKGTGEREILAFWNLERRGKPLHSATLLPNLITNKK